MKKTEKDPFDPNKKAEQPNPSAEPAGDGAPDPEKDSGQQETAPEPEGQDAPDGEESPQEQPEQEKPNPAEEPAPQDPAVRDEKTEQLKADLLEARSHLAAYAAGVRPEMVADAVTLATAQARAAGEVTEEAVTQAMGDVLKRHPDWKTAGSPKKTTGGFKLGADPDSPAGKKTAPKGGQKPWNKFNR